YTRVHNPVDHKIMDLGQNARLIHLKAGEKKVQKLAMYSHLPDFARKMEDFRENHGLRYDLVFSHYWLSGCVATYLQQWWHIPHISMFHTLGALKNATGIGEDESQLRIVTEGDVAKNCHHIIATTERERKELILRYNASPQKITVIPCGVNLERFQPADKETAKLKLGLDDEKIILYVGRIEPLKGVEQLLKAMPYLQNIQGLRLVIIGGDRYGEQEIEKLQKLSLRLHVQDMVTFRGFIKHEQLPYFYSASDACVVPSYYESFGLVVLESLACGTPVVATDVGDLKSIIRQGETGYVVPDNDPQHLADKINLLLSRQLDMESALKIRASVSAFDWSTIAQVVIRELSQVMAN
ncbi:glycosyltransferase, partial [Chloroflexota bacterium]